jgi:GT2 family glycosyltransferase
LCNRRSLIDIIKGFDEKFITCEDIDISIRARLEGYNLGYCQDAIVYHNHRSTIKGLIKQQYYYGLGFAQLHKKYPGHFSPIYNIAFLTIKIFYALAKFLIILLKIFIKEDKKYHLVAPFLHIAVSMSNLVGIIKETLFGEEYFNNKINQKLDFIKDKLNLCKKFFNKIDNLIKF